MIKKQGKLDALLLMVVLILVIFGVVMVFSASFYSTISADVGPYYYLSRALRWAIAGFIIMVVVSFIPYRIYFIFAPYIVFISLILLLLLFTPLGITINNSTRWLGVGSGDNALTFMPGEFAKLAVILGCAWYYTKYAEITRTFVRGFAGVIIIALLYFYLIYREPNLSTALIVVLTIIAMMYLAGVNIGYLAGMIVFGALGAYAMIKSGSGLLGYQFSRILNYTDPFSDAQGDFFQTVQGLLALGSGGLTGVGLGNSSAKALWLPFAQNDFIFAIIGEETGFIGCILVLIGYVVLIWRCMLIAMRCKDRFGMLVCGGIATLFAIQAGLNIGVVTNVLPPTGVILPFISYGGNAIILFMLLIGIVLNVSRYEGEPVQARRRKRMEEAA